ncbi:transporter [Paraburkholderia caballeronis]|uniref:Zinc transporter n=1 Tax=Paraburkholderia caballeronis TaxID=416943 RepID=A0A1H7P1Z2_9BURK|nr:transporter [Paraburkholderia caballeronis]PXW25449.1 zinc transporter [Paraburkholderia caballeronis]PXX01056.1 zinc transporter [Paraburkholderia caballeronis]RAJ99591.1 zinc transporter [Paraburkholderia caballeronis]TDV11430.1 zinc transporter [Paraburkholderia caballeronis]TDV14620.1 zinc transporter [Paraburkholderia caballeronis]
MNLSSTITAYGADMSGLICGFRFAPGKPGMPVSASDVVDALRGSAPGSHGGSDEEFFWLHFNLAHAASEHWMRTHLELPDSFFEALVEGSHSTRIEQLDGALLAVINDVMFDFELIPSQIATLWAYTHRRILVTARLKPLRSIDKLRGFVRDGETFRSPAELLVHLMRDQADLMVQIVRRTSIDVDQAEDQFLASKTHASRHALSTMRRMLVRLQRMLAPEPGSVFRLLARPPQWLHTHDVQDLRESTEEFSLVLGDMAGLVERIKLLQEEIAARLEEQNNRTLFTLTLVTVLALPINIVAGFFGMNVGGIPFAENRHGFWLMVVLVAGFTALAGWWAFRRRGVR